MSILARPTEQVPFRELDKDTVRERCGGEKEEVPGWERLATEHTGERRIWQDDADDDSSIEFRLGRSRAKTRRNVAEHCLGPRRKNESRRRATDHRRAEQHHRPIGLLCFRSNHQDRTIRVVDDLCGSRTEQPVEHAVAVGADDEEIRVLFDRGSADAVPERTYVGVDSVQKIRRYVTTLRHEVFLRLLDKEFRKAIG
jgi:hypothetical protein